MEITNFLHTAIAITNLEKAEHFYGKALGLERVERELRFPGAWYQVGEFQLHLIVTPDLASKDSLSEKWGRGRHIAFAVRDLEIAKQRLHEYGYPIQMSASGRLALFTQDPDCNVIELSAIS